MEQLTSIVGKRRKVRLKRQKYPMHSVLLQNSAQIISKKTVHFCVSSFCTDVNIQMITIHPLISVLTSFIFTNKNNRIIANHPRCKHHTKISPHINLVYLHSCTTIHMKIHLYVPVQKTLPRNPALRLSLHFIHISIVNTQTNFVTSFTKTP